VKKEWIQDTKVSGLGILRLKSGVETWYLRYREPGGKQQHHKIGRASVINRTLAREEAHKLLAAVARGESPTSQRQELRDGPTVADLHKLLEAKHYPKLRAKTRASYTSIWDCHILPSLSTTKVKQVTSGQVMKLLEKVGGTQANRTLAVLRKAMNLAILWNLRTDNPCAKVPGNGENKRERYLSDEELKRLVAALNTFPTTPLQWRFTQLVKLLILTGCRLNEVCSSRWEWFDEKAAVLVIPREGHKTGKKTGKDRVVHVPPAAIRILRELRLKSNSDWIIAGRDNGRLIGFQKLWRALLKQAKIQDLKAHDLRHHWASVAITEGNLTLKQVGGMLGHLSPLTTDRYAHLIDDGAKDMAKRVADQLGL
jgi:integrase